jgi:hypothetical protein
VSVVEATNLKQALFREVNERIRELSRGLGFARREVEVFCECTRPATKTAPSETCPASSASATLPLMSVEIFYCPV